VLAIDPRIIDAAVDRQRQEPVVFVDIYADVAARVAIDSRTQWTGVDDPMVGSDVSVSFDRVLGGVTLAAGAAVAAAYGGTDVLDATISMSGNVIAHWHTEGNFFTGTRLVLDSYDKTISSQVSEHGIPFAAQATSIVDELIVRTQYAGFTARTCYARLVDGNGNQVGRRVTFTPSLAVSTITLTGFDASISKGRDYTLLVGYLTFAEADLPNPGFVPSTNYTFSLSVFVYTVADAVWRIDSLNGAMSIGGQEGYQSIGSLTRQMDMGVIPLNTGTISFVDTVPATASQIVTLYHTDSSVIALEATNNNWTLVGVVESGSEIPAHQFWRAHIAQAANSANDEAPVMGKIEITYQDAPLKIGTHASMITTVDPLSPGISPSWSFPLGAIFTTEKRQDGIRGLSHISTVSAQMSPKVSQSMIGRMTATLAPEPAINDVMAKPLRGKQVAVRVGYMIDGSAVSSEIYRGIVADAAWNGKQYTLTIQDDMDIVDVKLPRIKAGAVWDATVDYAIGDVVVFGTNSWKALVASGVSNGGAVTPVSGATWQDNGTVWQDIVYTNLTSPDGGQEWHLADVCKDILVNHVNLPTQRIDLDSLAALKLTYPNMRGTRIITKPVGALTLLAELAWLLNAQWVMRQGKMALVEEPVTQPIEAITNADVKAGFSYRRGWKDLKNECLIMSGYTGDGEGDEQFLNSFAFADADSITAYEMVGLEVFKDKWSVPDVELQTRAALYVGRWKDGRRVLTNVSVSMRLLGMEAGDVSSFISKGLPPFDQGQGDYIIIRKDIDWKGQSLKMSFLEV